MQTDVKLYEMTDVDFLVAGHLLCCLDPLLLEGNNLVVHDLLGAVEMEFC